jgi:hypothetical protein
MLNDIMSTFIPVRLNSARRGTIRTITENNPCENWRRRPATGKTSAPGREERVSKGKETVGLVPLGLQFELPNNRNRIPQTATYGRG